MKNPWQEISLDDYENHMQLDSVMQLQTMNAMMKEQFYQYPVKTIMILGVAGGNGLEHIKPELIEKVFGIDINPKYLEECKERYPNLQDVLECRCADLLDETTTLPHADLVVANLLIEYIGYDCFQKTICKVKPRYVSCIIQINTDAGFVSDSPYLHVFDQLEAVHHQMEEQELSKAMEGISYRKIAEKEKKLPNGKKMVQIDFEMT